MQLNNIIAKFLSFISEQNLRYFLRFVALLFFYRGLVNWISFIGIKSHFCDSSIFVISLPFYQVFTLILSLVLAAAMWLFSSCAIVLWIISIIMDLYFLHFSPAFHSKFFGIVSLNCILILLFIIAQIIILSKKDRSDR